MERWAAAREIVLLVAFVLLVAAGIVTVLLPELRDDAAEVTRGRGETSHPSSTTDAGVTTP